MICKISSQNECNFDLRRDEHIFLLYCWYRLCALAFYLLQFLPSFSLAQMTKWLTAVLIVHFIQISPISFFRGTRLWQKSYLDLDPQRGLLQSVCWHQCLQSFQVQLSLDGWKAAFTYVSNKSFYCTILFNVYKHTNIHTLLLAII